MQRLRSFFSVLLMAMILPYGGLVPSATILPAAAPASAQKNFINLYIDEIKILGNTGDLSGPGEFRLIILATDKNGKSTGMFCPGDAPLKIRKGQTVTSPCLFGPSFDEAKVTDGVYLTVMAVDEDKAALPSDMAYEAASTVLGKAFGKLVKKGLFKVGLTALADSTPFTFAVDALFGLVTGEIKDGIQKADIIGSQGIYLSRHDNWSADKTTTVKSSDGGIRLTYTIVRTSSTPPHKKAPVLGSPSAPPSGASQPSTPKYWCDDLSYVKLKVGDSARVVWMKVNLRTAPVVPMNYYENSLAQLEEGTKLTVIGGPACAHNGTWWQVRTRGGKIGWMREHIKDGYLIGR